MKLSSVSVGMPCFSFSSYASASVTEVRPLLLKGQDVIEARRGEGEGEGYANNCRLGGEGLRYLFLDDDRG
jgi:hypothetical protein